MKTNILIVFFISVNILVGQNLGLRIGATTATITGNNDSYEFDFLDSFSPGYKLGLFGRYRLSDVIILKPEISYRLYMVNQKIGFESDVLYDSNQYYYTLSSDLNFDIELSYYWSLVFGMGLDYLLIKKHTVYFENSTETYNQNWVDLFSDERFDPFANIGLCYKMKKNILIDIEYRHLLDNWSVESIGILNQMISAGNGSVKLHMINLSVAMVF
tara:strand:- start:948 stop:1592 length:645 start_codon:yes stop_codon:yes gene_type:complete